MVGNWGMLRHHLAKVRLCQEVAKPVTLLGVDARILKESWQSHMKDGISTCLVQKAPRFALAKQGVLYGYKSLFGRLCQDAIIFSFDAICTS